MKKKWKSRFIRLKGPLLTFALAVGTVAAAPGLNGTAQAVDFNKTCTLTVQPGGGDFADDLAGADVVIDLYKIADAVPVDGHDTYTYSFLEGYTDLKLAANPDNAQWEALAQQAAKTAFGSGRPVISGEKAGSQMQVPGSGLYLAAARGNSIQDYITTLEDGKTATIAQSHAYTYTFTPALISLPGKAADENNNINTAGDGEWLYDLTVTLKPERSERYGSLEIVKTLQSYETKDPATFVFQVEATLGEGENAQKVYSNVVSLSFTAPGQKTKLIEKLPVGAHVTVTEIYSGAVYSLVTDDTQTTVIPANDIASVAFTNDYNNTNKGGGAVTNQFDYGEDNNWGWTKIPDDE